MSRHIIFDGPPDHDGPRFIEVEDEHGQSVNAGEWIDRGDGTWAMRLHPESTPRVPEHIQWDVLSGEDSVVDDVSLRGHVHMEMLDDDHAYLHVYRDGHEDQPVVFEIRATRATPRGKPVLRIYCHDDGGVPER